MAASTHPIGRGLSLVPPLLDPPALGQTLLSARQDFERLRGQDIPEPLRLPDHGPQIQALLQQSLSVQARGQPLPPLDAQEAAGLLQLADYCLQDGISLQAAESLNQQLERQAIGPCLLWTLHQGPRGVGYLHLAATLARRMATDFYTFKVPRTGRSALRQILGEAIDLALTGEHLAPPAPRRRRCQPPAQPNVHPQAALYALRGSPGERLSTWRIKAWSTWAASTGEVRILEALAGRMGRPQFFQSLIDSRGLPLLQAAQQGQTACMRWFMRSLQPAQQRQLRALGDGAALLRAAACGQADVVRALLEHTDAAEAERLFFVQQHGAYRAAIEGGEVGHVDCIRALYGHLAPATVERLPLRLRLPAPQPGAHPQVSERISPVALALRCGRHKVLQLFYKTAPTFHDQVQGLHSGWLELLLDSPHNAPLEWALRHADRKRVRALIGTPYLHALMQRPLSVFNTLVHQLGHTELRRTLDQNNAWPRLGIAAAHAGNLPVLEALLRLNPHLRLASEHLRVLSGRVRRPADMHRLLGHCTPVPAQAQVDTALLRQVAAQGSRALLAVVWQYRQSHAFALSQAALQLEAAVLAGNEKTTTFILEAMQADPSADPDSTVQRLASVRLRSCLTRPFSSHQETARALQRAGARLEGGAGSRITDPAWLGWLAQWVPQDALTALLNRNPAPGLISPERFRGAVHACQAASCLHMWRLAGGPLRASLVHQLAVPLKGPLRALPPPKASEMFDVLVEISDAQPEPLLDCLNRAFLDVCASNHMAAARLALGALRKRGLEPDWAHTVSAELVGTLWHVELFEWLYGRLRTPARRQLVADCLAQGTALEVSILQAVCDRAEALSMPVSEATARRLRQHAEGKQCMHLQVAVAPQPAAAAGA